jgi:hypothetical protein
VAWAVEQHLQMAEGIGSVAQPTRRVLGSDLQLVQSPEQAKVQLLRTWL